MSCLQVFSLSAGWAFDARLYPVSWIGLLMGKRAGEGRAFLQSYSVNYLDASSLLITPGAHHSLGNSDEEIGNYF